MDTFAPQIIVLSGLPGTGKSTLANIIRQGLEAPVLSTDATRIRLGLQGRYAAEDKFIVYDYLFREAKRLAPDHPLIILDGSFSSPASRAEAVCLADKLGRPIHFFYITADREVIRERLKATRKDSEADFAIYERMNAAFAPFGNLKVHVLDTTEQSPETIAQKLYAQLTHERTTDPAHPG